MRPGGALLGAPTLWALVSVERARVFSGIDVLCLTEAQQQAGEGGCGSRAVRRLRVLLREQSLRDRKHEV